MDTQKLLHEAEEIAARHARSQMLPVRNDTGRLLAIIKEMAGEIDNLSDETFGLAGDLTLFEADVALVLDIDPDDVAEAGDAFREQIVDRLLPMMTKANRDRVAKALDEAEPVG